MSATLHYRTVSLPKSMESRFTKEVAEDSTAPFAYNKRPRLPANYRRIRTLAIFGWSTSVLLFLYLCISNPSFSPSISRISNLNRGRPIPAQDTAVALIVKGGVTSRVTIVSGFYRIDSGKKHKVSEYNEWLKNFLGSVELPIVFFCAPAMRAQIVELRGDKPITIVSNYESAFDMPPLEKLGGYEWALAQHKIDPENNVHVPDLYGVWTAKPWIVKQAKDANPYHSEYFFWTDAGSFRDAKVKHTFTGLAAALDVIYDKVPDDTLILSATTKPMEKGTDFVKSVRREGIMDREDRLQGGWYGGKKAGIDWWEQETMKVTTLQAGLQRFAAKEQPVWTHTARLNWDRIYVQNMAQREGDCGPDMWFSFEYFADGRDCRVPAWVGPVYAKLESRWQHRQWNSSTTPPPKFQALRLA